MSLFIFFTVIQAIIAAALVGVVLMQRSEGGGLGIGGGGGGPGGMLSARGAADFLTRTTKWLAVLFVVFAIVLAGLAINASGTRSMDDTLDRSVESVDPLAPVTGAGGATAPAAESADEEAAAEDDPLADVTQ